MAEIHVQPKKKSPLPWILLGLLILAIIAFFLLRNTDVADGVITKDSVSTTTTDTVVRTNPVDTTR